MFESILGHERIREKFKKDLQRGSFQQSYMLTGQDHIGKMSLLREVIAQQRTGAAFQADSALAEQISTGRGPGYYGLMDDGSSLKVAQVRELSDFIAQKSGQEEVRFCVIEHMERMTTSAANAFLKMLEEPSAGVVYLLTARDERLLLPTITSRVNSYRCFVPPEAAVRDLLSDHVHDLLSLDELMNLSLGRVGLAFRLLEDEELLNRSRELFDKVLALFEGDIVDRFQIADHLSKKEVSSQDLEQFLGYLMQRLRHEGLERTVQPLKNAHETLVQFRETQVNKRLALEALFLSF